MDPTPLIEGHAGHRSIHMDAGIAHDDLHGPAGKKVEDRCS
jgi:hypothetical protein